MKALAPTCLKCTLLFALLILLTTTPLWAQGKGKPDTTDPADVTDLGATAVTHNTVTLGWTATGDDGFTGTATSYDVRYLPNQVLDDATWGEAFQAVDEPAPQASGSAEAFTVAGLSGNTTYYLALRVSDEAGNRSGLSNVVMVTTAPTPPGAWATEVVDEGGFYNGLAFTPGGDPVIAYSGGQDEVKLAQWNGASWDVEVVDGGGPGVDLALDPAGNPSISYGWGPLKFARRQGAAWVIDVIEHSGAHNDNTSLAYDGAGNPSISYKTDGKGKNIGDLRRAYWDGTGWQIEVIEAASARWNAQVFDAAGQPLIAYSDDLDGDTWLDALKLARWDDATGAWDIEIVESGVRGYGVYCSLALDPATGYPAISHASSFGVRVARWNGASWDVDALDPRGRKPRLAYRADGTLVVSYPNNDNDLRVARWDGAAWTTEIADVGDYQRTAIAFDGGGNLTLAYQDWTNRTLKFTRKLPGASATVAAKSIPSTPRAPAHRLTADRDEAEAAVAAPVPASVAAARLEGHSEHAAEVAPVPDGFILLEAYPNPFNPSTTIRFAVPEAMHVTLKVYSALGREVATLVDQPLAPDAYTMTWDAHGLPSGVYLYRLQAGAYSQSKRLTLLK